MPNVTIPKSLHLALYLACVVLTAVLYLASKGSIPITGSSVAVLSLVLSTLNSVDPATVLSKATPAQIEFAAKKLPADALARLAEYQKPKAV